MSEPYQETSQIKNRIPYNKNQFTEDDYNPSFDELIEMLEEESREIINSYMGDESFHYEEDRVDNILARETKGLSLVYPVRDVSKVEIKRYGEDWRELDTSRWTNDEHSIYLRKYPPQIFKGYEDRRYSDVSYIGMRWTDFCTEVRVTYDRGYEEIPANVKNIQISIITNILNEMRQKQANSVFDPSDNNLVIDLDQIMSKDIRRSLDDITSFGKNAVIL